MSKIFKIAAILLIPGGMIFGQSTSDTGYWGRQKRTEQQVKFNSQKIRTETQQMQALQLTDAQQHTVLQANTDYQNQLTALNTNFASYSDEQRIAKLKEFSDERSQKINAVLTKEQAGQLEKIGSK